MQSQGQIIDGLRNRLSNQGIFVSEKEVEYEGQNIIVYAVMPQSLASKSEEIMDGLTLFHDVDGHDLGLTEANKEVVASAIKESPVEKKKVVKPKNQGKKPIKKAKKK